MANKLFPTLRKLAAILMLLSGSGQVGSLWTRDLTGVAVIDALLGAVYLIIGIGLFGQSRFTLCMAILIPAACAWYVFSTFPYSEAVYAVRLATDAMVILLSVLVLWQVRNDPSA